MSTPQVAASLDAETFTALVGQAEVNAKSALKTEEAVSRSVLGATNIFVVAPMFLGQGTLELLRAASTRTS